MTEKAVDKAGDILKGAHSVLVPAGKPRQPGQDCKDLVIINVDIAKGAVEAIAKFCPSEVVALTPHPWARRGAGARGSGGRRRRAEALRGGRGSQGRTARTS